MFALPQCYNKINNIIKKAPEIGAFFMKTIDIQTQDIYE
jgi:hypothetical protein